MLSINAQTIKITVSEAQIFARVWNPYQRGRYLKLLMRIEGSNKSIVTSTFDLARKDKYFFSRSLGGEGNTLPIHNVIKKGNLYILEIADHGRHDASSFISCEDLRRY